MVTSEELKEQMKRESRLSQLPGVCQKCVRVDANYECAESCNAEPIEISEYMASHIIYLLAAEVRNEVRTSPEYVIYRQEIKAILEELIDRMQVVGCYTKVYEELIP